MFEAKIKDGHKGEDGQKKMWSGAKYVEVQEIGLANDGIKEGFIIGSFNAG